MFICSNLWMVLSRQTYIGRLASPPLAFVKTFVRGFDGLQEFDHSHLVLLCCPRISMSVFLLIVLWYENKTSFNQGWKIYHCSQLTLVLINFFYFRGIFLLFKAMDVFYFLWVDTSWPAVWHYRPLDRSWSRFVRDNWHSGDVHLQFLKKYHHEAVFISSSPFNI
jgi:hypothetical protein